ncbi:hypothetical protein [Pseudoneobacillus rhizosphaerae]|uniref:Uncharacterized protein n=1 Tax=Pseudoneobacillus rhizosphaerae TaxID=2880968 RepID=A0A9C7G9D7_9BACI|nr:hypothetical protein [Pseudoneobacillus rhizosphaerae]CAG9608065.1 hypothetical protein NEOCIP111885_01757 [Pseudoneobacillus rhizosphaerae]
MAMRYDSRTCTVFQNWEWVVTGYTPVTTTTTRKSVTTTQRWKYYKAFDTWAKDGSLSYEGSNFVETVAPPYPGGASADGATITTNGEGYADVTTTSGGDPINGWGRSGDPTHNASSSISFDDGTYAGTLYLDSVSGSPSSPSYNGSYIGQTDSTSTSGSAYYSGDVPLKDSGGGGTDPTPSLGVTAKNITNTSVRATIENLMFEANYYHLFEMELWRGNEEEYLITQSWIDSSNQHYTSFDFSGLNSGSTYTLKGFVKSTSTGGRVHAGTKVFTTTGTAVTRPTNWSWSTLISSSTTYDLGGVLRADVVSATDWNNFTKRINEFRKYKLGEGKDYPFTNAVSKTSLTSNHYEEARLAISSMTNAPASVSTGEKGVNGKIMALSNALNQIT